MARHVPTIISSTSLNKTIESTLPNKASAGYLHIPRCWVSRARPARNLVPGASVGIKVLK